MPPAQSEPNTASVSKELLSHLVHLSDSIVAANLDQSWQELLQVLGKLIDASAGFVVVGERTLPEGRWSEDPILGWRPVAYMRGFGELSEEQLAAGQRWAKADANIFGAPSIRRQVEVAGRHRAHMHRHVVTREEWAASSERALFEALGVHDRMTGVHNVTPGLEVYFGFDRLKDKPFSEEDAGVLQQAMPLIGRPVRWILLSLGIGDGRTLLTPRERSVLRRLLAAEPEKAVAQELGLSTSYVHQVVHTLYQKLNVASRAELLRLWM